MMGKSHLPLTKGEDSYDDFKRMYNCGANLLSDVSAHTAAEFGQSPW